jgi:hypothetical protein
VNTNFKFLLSAAIILAALKPQLSSALAQGTAFTYQGRLHDGASVGNGNYDLTFALFGAPIGGIQHGGTLTNAATPVSNGLFTVTLDFGNQYPGAERWLEIAVRSCGSPAANQVLSPRQPITPLRGTPSAPSGLHA